MSQTGVSAQNRFTRDKIITNLSSIDAGRAAVAEIEGGWKRESFVNISALRPYTICVIFWKRLSSLYVFGVRCRVQFNGRGAHGANVPVITSAQLISTIVCLEAELTVQLSRQLSFHFFCSIQCAMLDIFYIRIYFIQKTVLGENLISEKKEKRKNSV